MDENFLQHPTTEGMKARLRLLPRRHAPEEGNSKKSYVRFAVLLDKGADVLLDRIHPLYLIRRNGRSFGFRISVVAIITPFDKEGRGRPFGPLPGVSLKLQRICQRSRPRFMSPAALSLR